MIERPEDDRNPEQISGRLKAEGRPSVSHETIYRLILDDQRQGGNCPGISSSANEKAQNAKDLRDQIPNRVSIDDRPSVVDERILTGYWELEAMIGKNHRGALITIVERKTRFTLIGRLPRGEAILLKNELVAMLSPYRGKVVTITAEDGKENSEHQEIACRLGAEFFFAHPYSRWERRLNESTNELIRQYLPKKSSFEDIDKELIKIIQDKLNNRPRRCLDCKTPAELFLN